MEVIKTVFPNHVYRLRAMVDGESLPPPCPKPHHPRYVGIFFVRGFKHTGPVDDPSL